MKSIILLAILFCLYNEAIGQSIECVEDLNDFALNAWSASPQWEYEGTSAGLPGILKNKFEGEGIWWIEGGKDFVATKSFLNDPFYSPAFLYVKYYKHIQVNSPEKQAKVHPSLESNSRYTLLHDTSDFVWGEQVVELNVTMLEDGFLVGVSEIDFDVDEYFLVERMIIAQGYDLNGKVNDIKELCGWSDPDVPTTEAVQTTQDVPTTEAVQTTQDVPTTEAVQTTQDVPTTEAVQTTQDVPTTRPPGPGFCQEAGFFADPEDCTKFHVCRLDENTGDFIDEIFTCPVTTVWCQRTLECEAEDTCPCTNKNYFL